MAKRSKKNPYPKKGTLISFEDWTARVGPEIANFIPEYSAAERIKVIRETSAPGDFAARLSKISSKYPELSPNVAVGMAGVGASDDALDTVARLNTFGQAQPINPNMDTPWNTQINSKVGDTYNYLNALAPNGVDKASAKDKQDGAWFRGLKTSTRYLTTALYTPLQMLINTGRQLDAAGAALRGGELSGGLKAGEKALDFTQIFKDTYLWQNLVENKNLGEGYFWGGEALDETERIAGQVATVNGANWTAGRSIEGMVGIDPGDRGYGILSGIIDGALSLVDPVAVAGKAKAVKDAAKYSANVRNGAQIANDIVTEMANIDKTASRIATNTATRKTADARGRMQLAGEELRKTYNDIIDQYIQHDQLIADGSLVEDSRKVNNLRKKTGIDNLYAQREKLLEQVNKLRTEGTPVLDTAGQQLSKGASAKFLRQEINKVDKDITTAIDKIYVQNDPAASKLLNIAREEALARLGEYTKRASGAVNEAEMRRLVEKERAGLMETSSDLRMLKDNGKQWLAEGNADELFQSIANATSPYEINKLVKGKFGAEMSAKLAAAKTIDEVENIILPEIGLKVLPNAPRGVVGRYADEVLNKTKIRPGSNTSRVGRANVVLKRLLDKAPKGRPISINDTESLTEQVRRWMVGARQEESYISEVWDKLATSDVHNYPARVRIITEMLDNVAAQYGEKLNLPSEMRARLRQVVTAFDSELNGSRQFAARNAGDTVGKKAVINNETIDLSGIPTSVSQLAHEIVLPNVNDLRELTGYMAKATRWLDSKRGGDSDFFEKASFAVAHYTRATTDGFLRQILLAYRVAFIARNIMEMQVRTYLSSGRSVVTNPMETIAMAVAVGKRDGILKSIAQGYDPYVIDATGKRFIDQTYDYNTQQVLNSYFNVMQERGFANDGRSVRGAINTGEWTTIKFGERGVNAKRYADALAHRLLMHHSDPIKRVIAAQELPEAYMKKVRSGAMSFEDALIRAIRDGKFSKQMDILTKSVEEIRRLMATDEGARVFLFTDQNSYLSNINNETMGSNALKQFIGTGKIVENDKVLFELGTDYVKNTKDLSKYIERELNRNEEFARRANALELPDVTVADYRTVGAYKRSIDAFFRLSARAETRMVYGPEYRIRYWEAVAELAPLMSKEAALKILSTSDDIKKTKVAETLTDGTIQKTGWIERNPAFNDIVQASKSGDGFLTANQIDEYASDAAAKHIQKLFYDATEKQNLVYALQLVFPFINAWGNTVKKWGQLASSPNRIATRVMPATKLFSNLQSNESSALYDFLGTPHDPSQGFIHEDAYGEKVFTIPMSGYLRTLFGVFGDPRQADITMPVNSLNLLFAGADLPGSEVGITPGVGFQLSFPYSILPSSMKDSIPPVLSNIIAPYGNVNNPAPAWLKKIAGGMQGSPTSMKFVKGIMAYEATTNPKYMKLYDGTPLTVEERATLQEELASDSITQSQYQYFMQGLLQSVLPGTPVYEYYAKNENGDTFFQWQMANALNTIIDANGGNYELGYAEYANIFGRNAVMATMSPNKGAVFANDRAWQFATANPDAFKAYSEVIPYFFTGGEFSSEYKAAMNRRGVGEVLSAKELIAESDKLSLAAAKGQLAIYAARNNLDANWIDEQMKNYKMDVFQGYEPEVVISTNRLAQKILKIESALKRPEFVNTAAGKAAVQYSAARAQALAEAKVRYPNRQSASLDGAENMDLRQELSILGQQLSRNNPDFANMFNRVYSQELRTE